MHLSSHGYRDIRATPAVEPPLVIVVDDDVSMRESLESLIRFGGWQAETYSSAEEFLARPRTSAPGCVVLDYRLPELDGLALQQRLVADGLHLPVIFVTCFGDPPMAVQAMKAGALEVLMKPFGDDDLLAAIRLGIVRSQLTLIRQAQLRQLHECYATLSKREKEIMQQVILGKLNKHIAADLQISEITVKAHRGRVMSKMRADSLAQLVYMAMKLNLESMLEP